MIQIEHNNSVNKPALGEGRPQANLNRWKVSWARVISEVS